MLKIKSKALLAFTGLMVALFMLAGANFASADVITLPSSGVSKTSGMENIQNLQLFLNWNLGAQITPLVVDGKYGAKTTAAIKLFQANNGLVADGIFGRMSAAKAMALQVNATGVVYPAGCASNTGYSSTTGWPCAGMALPAGCTSTVGFSSTTGVPCGTPVGTTLPAGCASAAGFSTTTGAPCTATTTVSGTNGYLADISTDSTNRVSTVYESEMDKVVAGFRATARLSSQTVDRVRVTMCNDTDGVTTNGVCSNTTSSSNNLSKYISSASLWYGSTKIATMAVAQADRGTSNDVYTFNFSGLNAVIAKDQIGRFYVSVSANGSIDTNDGTAKWVTTFPAGGISATSPDGSSDTYPSNDISQASLTFGKFSTSGVKAEINLSANNPAASVVTVQSTTATNNINLLKFTIKATNSDLTLRKVPVKIAVNDGSTVADDVTNVINTLKLYRGTDVVDSVDGSAGYQSVSGSLSTTTAACVNSTADVDDTCTFFFSNLSNPANFIAAGTTAEFTVVADLKQVSTNYAEGVTVTASLDSADLIRSSAFSVQDTNGDQLSDNNTSVRVGSAIGQVMTLRVNGVQVVMGTPSYTMVTDNGDVTQVTYTIPVTATAFGQTLYIGQSVVLGDTAGGTGASANAFSYSFENSTSPSAHINSCTNCVTTLSSSDALIEGNGYRLDSGTAKHFTITVVEIQPTTGTASYRVVLNQIRTDVESTLENVTTPLVNQELEPEQNYQTGFQYITG
ncbi:MAG: peptidoglycan-binding domain-containing protein [Patescibacteria group bacterium]